LVKFIEWFRSIFFQNVKFKITHCFRHEKQSRTFWVALAWHENRETRNFVVNTVIGVTCDDGERYACSREPTTTFNISTYELNISSLSLPYLFFTLHHSSSSYIGTIFLFLFLERKISHVGIR